MSPGRLLDVLAGDDAESSARRLRALRVAALLSFAADFLLWAHASTAEPVWLRVGLPALLGACLLLGLRPGRARSACALAALALFGYGLWTFPATGNHPGLYCAVAVMLASFDPHDPAERASVLAGLRWLTVVVLFWTGLQKVLAGTYFQAEFLTWAVANLPRFHVVFAPLIPADELARLAQIDVGAIDAGPYRLRAPLFVAASNAAWLGETLFAAALIPRATRVPAALAAIALLVAIEVAAHEVFFGGFFASLLLLFLPDRIAPRTLWPLALLYALALGAALVFGDVVVIT